jgi:hypothetical protein
MSCFDQLAHLGVALGVLIIVAAVMGLFVLRKLRLGRRGTVELGLPELDHGHELIPENTYKVLLAALSIFASDFVNFLLEYRQSFFPTILYNF